MRWCSTNEATERERERERERQRGREGERERERETQQGVFPPPPGLTPPQSRSHLPEVRDGVRQWPLRRNVGRHPGVVLDLVEFTGHIRGKRSHQGSTVTRRVRGQ